MLWAVTCYYNPSWFRRPLENYRRFASRLKSQGVPLLTVELALGGNPFFLDGDVARLRSRSVLWHKEALLNRAASLLPPECDKVVWSDSDILYEDGAFDRISEALDRHDVVQGFDKAYRLFPEQEGFALENPDGEPLWAEDGVARRAVEGKGFDDASFGFCWAARREFFRGHGLYDRAVLGGGDTLLFDALLGNPQPNHLGPGLTEWAARVRGLSLGYAENRVCHLWHGDLANRRYSDRHEILVRHAYDPLADVRDAGGVLEWATRKPGLHAEVRDYFLGRREDG